jgi:hypothetical protein
MSVYVICSNHHGSKFILLTVAPTKRHQLTPGHRRPVLLIGKHSTRSDVLNAAGVTTAAAAGLSIDDVNCLYKPSHIHVITNKDENRLFDCDKHVWTSMPTCKNGRAPSVQKNSKCNGCD